MIATLAKLARDRARVATDRREVRAASSVATADRLALRSRAGGSSTSRLAVCSASSGAIADRLALRSRAGHSTAGRLALLVIAALVPATAIAQELTVNVSVSEQRVNVGDSISMEITVVSHVDAGIELSIPQVEGLNELSRSKSEGTSISWTGRGQQITREYTVMIELEAAKAGQLTIPPITARAGTKSAQSRPITIEVGGAGSPSASPSRADPNTVAPPGAGEHRVFLRYKVDRATAYVGQQVLLDLDVYADPSLNFAIDENAPPPTLDGFWREVVDQPQRLTRRTEIVGGRQYHVYRLWRLALFPLEAGERVIPAVQLTFAVNRSIFGGGQRDRRRPPEIAIDVKPLPTEGKPASFPTGNVGAYTLSASVDNATVRAGKAVVLTVTASGRGNVKNLKLPELPAFPGFRAFPPTVTDNVAVESGGVSGSKKAEILLMPELGGRLEIPALELVVFNPEVERYERLQTNSIRIAVEGDPAAVAGANQTPASIDGAGLGGDRSASLEPARVTRGEMRPLRYRSRLTPHGNPPWQSVPFAAMFFAPPLFYALIVASEFVLARARRETPESRRRAAARHARGRLDKAREAAAANDGARAYQELVEALLHLASEKTGLAFRGMTTEEMKRALETRGATPALVEKLAAEIDGAMYARFVPGAYDAKSIASALERTEVLLSKLEQWEVRS